MSIQLTARERAHLKARAHALEPSVQIGQGGLTDKVVAEVDRALTAHELVKIKILGDDRDEREAVSNAVCERTDASFVQRVGKVTVLWRPKQEKGDAGE
jgi:RNA-binding protein